MIQFTNDYPEDWDEIAKRTKDEAGWKCIRCDHKHCVETAHVLTVHHLDGNKANSSWWNLLALCQRCHLHIQAKVDPQQPYMFEHSEWFKPYIAGYYAFHILVLDLTREEIEADIDRYLNLVEKFS